MCIRDRYISILPHIGSTATSYYYTKHVQIKKYTTKIYTQNTIKTQVKPIRISFYQNRSKCPQSASTWCLSCTLRFVDGILYLEAIIKSCQNCIIIWRPILIEIRRVTYNSSAGVLLSLALSGIPPHLDLLTPAEPSYVPSPPHSETRFMSPRNGGLEVHAWSVADLEGAELYPPPPRATDWRRHSRSC